MGTGGAVGRPDAICHPERRAYKYDECGVAYHGAHVILDEDGFDTDSGA